MNKLIDLYNKNNHTSDKHNSHTYLHVYENLFKRFKDKPIKLLEIGLYKGDSLNLWSEYFHESSSIYGLDLDVSQINVKLHDNVLVTQNDAYSVNTIELLKLQEIKFDIIIDDGPHTVEQQIFFMKNYFDFLNKDGILILEDAMCWEQDKYGALCRILSEVPDRYKAYTYYNDRRKLSNNEHDFLVISDLTLFNSGLST